MERFEISCKDGWRIQLKRYPGLRPVLFVHGMGANSSNFDLNPKWSLARYLNDRGYDCWIVELRGRGRSRPPDGLRRPDWNFEDFLLKDLTAAVEFMRSHNPRPYHWIGHSMGGMLGYCWAIRNPGPQPESLVLFGTPLGFDPAQWALRLWGMAVQVHRMLPTVDQRTIGRLAFPLMNKNRRALNFFLRYLANPDNIEDQVARDIFDRLVTNESAGIILQFADWVRNGHVRSADRSFDYTENLDRVTQPVLLISGESDRMAPPAVAEKFIPRLGSRKVRHVVLRHDGGFSCDYGHGDLVLGCRAPEEVYPLVAGWLE
ncbi:MAG: alpha/beta fold hydrolase, partial [Deltaproteobacteria bacterium]